MKSAGNDIVALALTDDERTCRYRFYSRILTPGEISLYDGGLSFSSFVWWLWSIKESAYKYVSRSDSRLVFAPLKFRVSRLRWSAGYYEGFVQYGDRLLYSRSWLTPGEAILSVVHADSDFSDVRWGLGTIGDPANGNQSWQVRASALESLSRDFPGASLQIVKSPDGPPEVWDGERLLDIPISLAHHGKYVAWSYCFSANSSSYKKPAAN